MEARRKAREAMRAQAGTAPLGGAVDTNATRLARQETDDEMDRIRKERARRQQQQGDEKRRAAGLDASASSPDASPDQQQLAHAAQLQQESTASLANSLRLVNEANQNADSTMDQLQRQREQLEKMDQTLDETNESVTRSERILKGMKSIGGAISNWFTKPKAHETMMYADSKHASAADADAVAGERQRDSKQKSKTAPASSSSASSSSSSSAASFANSTTSAERIRAAAAKSDNASSATAMNVLADGAEQEDQMLDQISMALKQLQVKGGNMNKELTQQNHLIDHLDDKVSHTTTQINKQNKTINRIL